MGAYSGALEVRVGSGLDFHLKKESGVVCTYVLKG